jgi:DNA-binding MarR family transcriptional regulator
MGRANGRRLAAKPNGAAFVETFGLGLALRCAYLRAAAAFAAALAPLGIQLKHFAVLVELAEQSPPRQSELAARTVTDKVSMMRIVDHLEGAGLVVRRAQPGHRRVRAVEMTEDGRRMFEAAHQAAQDVSAGLLGHLSPADRRRFIELLARFCQPPTPEPTSTPRTRRAGP